MTLTLVDTIIVIVNIPSYATILDIIVENWRYYRSTDVVERNRTNWLLGREGNLLEPNVRSLVYEELELHIKLQTTQPIITPSYHQPKNHHTHVREPEEDPSLDALAQSPNKTYAMSLSLITSEKQNNTNELLRQKFENVQLFFIFKNDFCY